MIILTRHKTHFTKAKICKFYMTQSSDEQTEIYASYYLFELMSY